MDKVSIIIYCHNQVDSIQSVLDQQNIVIIDDASDDESWKTICNTLNCPDKIEEFEFKQTHFFARRNEFKDGPLHSLYEGSKVFWDKANWFGLLVAPNKYSAGKIYRYMDEADENFGYIYSDYIQNGFHMFEQSNRPSRIDTGFFSKSLLEKIDIHKIKDEAHFLNVVQQNFLTFHIPESLQTIA